MMPAAALLYRRGHVRPAEKTYCLMPDAATLFGWALRPEDSSTIRTLAEQSRLTIGIPEVKELPWLKPTKPGPEAIVVTDLDRDFIPEGQDFVRSDTGELTRDWKRGIQTIDTPRTQAVVGWVGGEELRTRDASFAVETKKAAVVLSSIDDRPLAESEFILVTAVARTIPSPGNKAPLLSEPVRCRITLRSRLADPVLLAIGPSGRVVGRPALGRRGDTLTFRIPAARGTHWYVLKSARSGGRSTSTGADEARTSGDGR